MRNFLLPLLIPIALPLGGCAYVGLAPLVAEAVGEASRGGLYAGEGFADAAAEGCRGRAARHGRVAITQVEPNDANSMRVYGTIEDPYGGPGRTFSCIFRSSGEISSFRRS